MRACRWRRGCLTDYRTKVDALVCGNDVMAIGARDAAIRLLHRHVPGDLAIVGQDGISMVGWECHDLTSLALDHVAFIDAIVQLIERHESATARLRPLLSNAGLGGVQPPEIPFEAFESFSDLGRSDQPRHPLPDLVAFSSDNLHRRVYAPCQTILSQIKQPSAFHVSLLLLQPRSPGGTMHPASTILTGELRALCRTVATLFEARYSG